MKALRITSRVILMYSFVAAGTALQAQTLPATTAASAPAAAPIPISFTGPGSKEDQATLTTIVNTLESDQPSTHVSPDLDWENAFGIRYYNLKKRDAFYGEVVKPQFKTATATTLEIKVKFLKPDFAVADTYWHVVGQIYGGETKPGPDRWGRTTYIFTKDNGQWTEVIERVADLRQAYYKHFDALPAAVPVPAETLALYAGKFEVAPGRTAAVVTVNGDRLSILSRGTKFTAVPISSNEFLSFIPDDLAEYYKVTFTQNGDAAMTLTLARADGEVLAKASKAKAE